MAMRPILKHYSNIAGMDFATISLVGEIGSVLSL